MKLREYFEKNGISVSKFARLVGVSTATIYNVLSEKRSINLEDAIKIEDITKKQVTCRDLIATQKKPKS